VKISKQGSIVVHAMEGKPKFETGDTVELKVDFGRRLQLAQHHTATHIINGVSKQILGNHIWQAGANKDIDKARLDITHYDALSKEEISKIEKAANDVIEQNLPVYSELMQRNLAESKFGFTIYQGGAVPGKVLRIVRIPGLDVEACGGTHLNLTGEAKLIKILKTTKIQDGIVRLEFVAGDAAANFLKEEMAILQEAARMLDCKVNQVPGRAAELFDKWKNVVKKGKTDALHHKLSSLAVSEGNLLEETAAVLNTQDTHIVKTITRFLKDLENHPKR
jgi:alanyl-tRNA synthetase